MDILIGVDKIRAWKILEASVKDRLLKDYKLNETCGIVPDTEVMIRFNTRTSDYAGIILKNAQLNRPLLDLWLQQ